MQKMGSAYGLSRSKTPVADGIRDEELERACAESAGARGELVPCVAPESHRCTPEGVRFYRARVAAGMTREALEDRLLDAGLRVDVPTIRAWEHGEADDEDVSAVALLALARVLRVSLGALLFCATCQHGAVAADRHVLRGDTLAARREALGFSREDFATMTDLDVRTVELLERGKVRCVSIDDVLAVADALDVGDVNELLGTVPA
jgi:transcriptional regulator with XRE-family HTH domain